MSFFSGKKSERKTEQQAFQAVTPPGRVFDPAKGRIGVVVIFCYFCVWCTPRGQYVLRGKLFVVGRVMTRENIKSKPNFLACPFIQTHMFIHIIRVPVDCVCVRFFQKSVHHTHQNEKCETSTVWKKVASTSL